MDSDVGVEAAAAAVKNARALLITAGAGMGVDSGLPDFRGSEGFWNAYPPYRHLGLSFADLANPRWFRQDPQFAWGFYGHRLHLYRATAPHVGFSILRRWAQLAPAGAFVFTSNVDGQFQRAGFADDRVTECHGSIHWLQCARSCHRDLWPAEGVEIAVDSEFRAAPPLPACPRCGGVARPNILMFGDGGWESSRTDAQHDRMATWRRGVGRGLVVIELGAGTAISTVRDESEHHAANGAALIRVNIREPQGPPGTIGIALGAAAALAAIDARLASAPVGSSVPARIRNLLPWL
jgi:NAD-dependent SIR2 family protein deacetylase